MAFSSNVLRFLFLLSLFAVSISSPSSSSSSSSIRVSLSHFHTNPSPDPYPKLKLLAAQSLSRARRLKSPRREPPGASSSSSSSSSAAATSARLSVHSYGGYSIPLSFGTPPQTLQFVMDTGSDMVWFPCTHKYLCNNCSFTGSDPADLAPFIPKLSSSAKILGCLNRKCGWIHHANVTRCRDCEPNSRNCTQICPPYIILYGSGTTGGFGLVDTLNFPGGKKVPDVVVGCSVFSSRQPAGIAGFGRGMLSLPSQLGLKKFSYCLLSRKFDDTAESTDLVLDNGSDSGRKSESMSYTPFVKNPTVAGKEAFSVYYYVGLRKITVGGKRVKIPYEYLSPSGDGGTIVDSGSTFTYMSGEVLELVLNELVTQAKGYRRASEIEFETGIRPCFNVSGGEKAALPKMKLHFKGGAEMELPLENAFVMAGETGAVCLAMVTDNVIGPASSDGPAIILGSFQMQNFYVEYDLRNERFGFRQQPCK